MKDLPKGTRVLITKSDLFRGKAGVVIGKVGAALVIRLDTGGQVNLMPGCVRREVA